MLSDDIKTELIQLHREYLTWKQLTQYYPSCIGYIIKWNKNNVSDCSLFILYDPYYIDLGVRRPQIIQVNQDKLGRLIESLIKSKALSSEIQECLSRVYLGTVVEITFFLSKIKFEYNDSRLTPIELDNLLLTEYENCSYIDLATVTSKSKK